MELTQFFAQHPAVALGFSGGVDSSYLLYAGLACGADVRPYFIKTAFQPQFELDDARRLADALGVKLTVLELSVLDNEEVVKNPADRCYACKSTLFAALKAQALADGYKVLIDGTNASDDAGDRPGMRALSEMSVRSPLKECGITKDQVRSLSKAAGLFTWDKPSYACLATRIPTGRRITAVDLAKVEQAEGALFELGFSDLRVRLIPNGAKLQIPLSQMQELLARREDVLTALTPLFPQVLLDLEGR